MSASEGSSSINDGGIGVGGGIEGAVLSVGDCGVDGGSDLVAVGTSVPPIEVRVLSDLQRGGNTVQLGRKKIFVRVIKEHVGRTFPLIPHVWFNFNT